MPDETKIDYESALVKPIGDVLYSVARGISSSQILLDESSIATQVMLDNSEGLGGYELSATWYQFAETTVELKLAVSLHKKIIRKTGAHRAEKLLIGVSPVNAEYVNQYNYNVEGACTVKAKIVPIPPKISRWEED